MAIAFLCCAVFSVMGARAQADLDVALGPAQQETVIKEALAKYDEGIALRGQHSDHAAQKFEEAAEQFELLARSGVRNGKLYYDLANAQLQANKLGPAILNYRRAQLYMPGDPRIASNLEYARSLVRSRIEESGKSAIVSAVIEAVDIVPRQWRLSGALLLYVGVWLFATLRLVKPSVLPKSLVWWCVAGSFLLGATVIVPVLMQRSAAQGVIMQNDVVVRMGNGEGFDPQFAEPIQEGVEFSVRERRGEWIEIELPNSGTGWIRADQAQLI